MEEPNSGIRKKGKGATPGEIMFSVRVVSVTSVLRRLLLAYNLI